MDSPKILAKYRHCPACDCLRPHAVRPRKDPLSGRVVKVRECAACRRAEPVPFCEHPGLACPRCGDTRLVKFSTRHRVLATVRVRACRGCGHRIRTVERIESNSA
jgi:DNA-directed RNA polymerase subunit RPC12/RpoP